MTDKKQDEKYSSWRMVRWIDCLGGSWDTVLPLCMVHILVQSIAAHNGRVVAICSLCW